MSERRLMCERTAVPKDQSSVLERWAEDFNNLLNQYSETDHTILEPMP